MGIHTQNFKGQFYWHRSQIRVPSPLIMFLINGRRTNSYVMFNRKVFLEDFVLVEHEAAKMGVFQVFRRDVVCSIFKGLEIRYQKNLSKRWKPYRNNQQDAFV
jgi:hypothetical protein